MSVDSQHPKIKGKQRREDPRVQIGKEIRVPELHDFRNHLEL
jgi:hypothetical protein